jgi:hypothetical protein
MFGSTNTNYWKNNPMTTLRVLSNQLPELKTKYGVYNARVIVRIDGKDYDVSHLSIGQDGILGE